MTVNSQEEAFNREMDMLWSHGRRPTSLEIARLAVKANLSTHKILQKILQFSEFGRFKPSEAFHGLEQFVEAVCEEVNPQRCIEYSDLPVILSQTCMSNKSGKIVVKNTDYASAFKHIYGEEKVAHTLGSLGLEKSFDLAICHPAIGCRSKGTDADGFGGEVVNDLMPLLTETGILVWITSRGALFNTAVKKTFSNLGVAGLHLYATVDIPPGGLPGTQIEGVVFLMGRQKKHKKLIAALRNEDLSRLLVTTALSESSAKSGPNWEWVAPDDPRSFADVENERLLRRLAPSGDYEYKPLESLLAGERVSKADKAPSDDGKAQTYIYIPEYAGSSVSDELGEMTVKSRAIYRVPIDTRKANPGFLIAVLNSTYGKKLRYAAARGVTIQRINVSGLLSLSLPMPSMETQDEISRIESDLALLEKHFQGLKESLANNWAKIPEASETVGALKSVLNIEQKIESWWGELPYPLAAIYRRYQVTSNPKEKVERLLHFFELAAVYLAVVGASHIKALRPNWDEQFSKWLFPQRAAGIRRADFGFWINLAGSSLKDLKRISSTPELRKQAEGMGGGELLEVSSRLAPLSNSIKTLDVARRHRNDWKGHGGHMKMSDAERLDKQLQQSIRDFYEDTASVFRQLLLVKPGSLNMSAEGFSVETQLLRGSDPAFESRNILVDRPSHSNTLAFWSSGSKTMCQSLPFFRMGTPQEPQETSCYVLNRAEDDGFRWISYQEARQQDFVAQDSDLDEIIRFSEKTT